MRILALALVLALAACSKVNQESFSRIQDGMTEEQVIAILGRPTESSSINVLGVSGTSSRWTSGDTTITIRFVGGKVALKSLEQQKPK